MDDLTPETGSGLDFSFPAGLHPRLQGLAWLLGHWEGFGQLQWPGSPEKTVLQQIDFAHNGEPYLHYLLQAFDNDEGRMGKPVMMETGFWIPGEGNELMVVLCNPDGVAQTWHGTITGLKSVPGGELATRVDLATDAVLSRGTHTAGQRLYGYVHNKLMYAYDRADTDVALQSHLSGELERR